MAPLRERVVPLKRDLVAAERAAEVTLDGLIASGVAGSPTAKRRLAAAETKVSQIGFAIAEAEGELSMREGEQLNAEVMAQALGSFDEAFDHLTSDERREFLRLMIKQVTVHKDRAVGQYRATAERALLLEPEPRPGGQGRRLRKTARRVL